MKKLVSHLSLLLILFCLPLAGCEETVKSTYSIAINDSSQGFNANLYLQIALNNYIAEYNEAAREVLRTEKEARSWFETSCDELQTRVNDLGLPMVDDTWVVLELTDYVNTIETRQIYFK